MNQTDQTAAVQAAGRAVGQAMAENQRAMKEFLATAGLVQSAYTTALGRVRQELSQLGQSLRGAAAVGLNAFAALLRGLRPVARGISRLLTGLFGVTYWKETDQSARSAAAALGRVSRATRSVARAQRELYSFDQITRVSAPGGSGGGSTGGRGGSGGSAGSGLPGAGELVHLPGRLEAWAARARDVLAQIWRPMQVEWKRRGKEVLQQARQAVMDIAAAIAAVGGSWLAVWTDGAGQKLCASVLHLVKLISITAGQLAQRFREAWQSGETGKAIFEHLMGMAQAVLDAMNGIVSATALWASRLDCSGLVKGFASLVGAIRPLVELVTNGLRWAYTQVLLPLAGWVISSAGPAALQVMAGGVQLLTAALQLFQPVANFVWERLLKPMGYWAGNTLIAGLHGAAAAFSTLAEALNGLPALWEKLRSGTANVWAGIQNTIVGAADSSRAGALRAFSGLSDSLAQQGKNLKAQLGELFGGVVATVGKKLSGLGSALTTPFRNGFNGVVALLNKLIGRINNSLTFSWKAIKLLGQTVVPAGKVTLAQMPQVAKLAQGGVTQGATLSLIGEAGREAVLPLEHNTGWMDVLADRLARAVSGSGRGETRVEVYVGGRALARQMIHEVNAITREQGGCPLSL